LVISFRFHTVRKSNPKQTRKTAKKNAWIGNTKTGGQNEEERAKKSTHNKTGGGRRIRTTTTMVYEILPHRDFPSVGQITRIRTVERTKIRIRTVGPLLAD